MAGKAKLAGKVLADSLKLLQDVTIVLEEEGIPYILDGGTLLGVIREQRLLPWDTDMDLSVDHVYIDLLLKSGKKIRRKGYRVSFRRFREDTGPFKKDQIRVIKIRNMIFPGIKGKAVLDIFLRQNAEERSYWAVGEKNPVLPNAPIRFFEELTSVDFNGKLYTVPSEYEEFLAYRYGDWKTPVKVWNAMKDDGALGESE